MGILHYEKNKQWKSAEGTKTALARFKSILEDSYPDTEIGIDENCVTMRFGEFRLDVVPAFKFKEGGYSIPDTVDRRSIRTDPTSFAEKITAINKTMEGDFIPLIKMVKGWNRNEGWPIKSFHLECMMYGRFKSYAQTYTYNSMLKVFFGALAGYVANPCYDPITGERVDSYLGTGYSSKRNAAIAKANAAAAKAAKALSHEEKNPSVAIGEWEELLGDFFPAYG